MSTSTEHVTITAHAGEFILAMNDVRKTMQDFGKAMRQLGHQTKILRRDLIRANRRPALIHNGRKPR